MKLAALMLASFLILAADSSAQQTQVVTDNQQIKVEVTTYPETCSVLLTGKTRQEARISDNACTELAITNKSPSPITAWAAETIRYLRGRGTQRVFRGARSADNLLTWDSNMNAPLILPRDTHRVIMGSADKVEFEAAIFQDGSTVGDPEWIKHILQSRRQHYQEAAEAIGDLRAAIQQGTPVAQLAQELQSLQQKEREEIVRRSKPGDPLTWPLGGTDPLGTAEANLGPGEPGVSAAHNQRIEHDFSIVMNLASKLLLSCPPIADPLPPLGDPIGSPVPAAATRPASGVIGCRAPAHP